MPGLLRGVARTAVVAGTATAVSNRVSRRQAGRWAQQDMAAEPAPPPPPPAPAAPAATSMDEKLAQLQQLGQLRDQGVLTEEEFAAQKQRLLAG
ncbi:SHOCT domain-containing protein [Streptomyces kaniharaensis]|uniref:SHOCT domain-containing protein n=1 Tax=Streptomyces kaniharaensis TaxID=212423 RepID=A0A6N7KKH0_9ACTN|nr:SHOCT domain-containing protein [Streptomyces kaniharaensis]MQS11049.1 SHOCT domain-containing protein [Streptomyces kaniharaensis]